MRSEIYIGPVSPPSYPMSVWHPHAREPEPRVERLSQDGARVFDAYLGCWVIEPEPEPDPVLLGKTATPVWDGSGVFWTVWCDGRPMWVIEAYDFDRALVEKRRLCRLVGGRSGWARLSPGVPEY